MSTGAISQHWYRRGQLFFRRPPDHICSWLFDASSLTARLIRYSDGDFRVELLSEKVCRPTRDEAEILNITGNRSALIRQVRLYCRGKAVVYARTVIPMKTLSGAQRSYGNLDARPLGAMLFSDRTMRRDEVMVTQLTPENLLYEKTGAQGEAVWGRRSVFSVGGKPLLVSEYYLPALFTD